MDTDAAPAGAARGWQHIRLASGGEEGGEGLPPHVALITIDRPRNLNALNSQVLDELQAAAAVLAADAAVRAVVITGAGDRSFVAGADIGEMAELDVMEGTAFGLKGQEVFADLAAMPKPVIAAIGGYCLGGGMELALACDIRVAAASARMGQPEVGLGICPGFGGTQRMARLVGPGKAKELIFSAAPITGEEAHRIGLVDVLAGPGEHLTRALQLAGKIAGQAPLAVARAKEAIDRGADLPLAEALRLEAALFGRCFGSEDQREGMRAFLEKRKPTFHGR
ncbi:MAG: enoyl-CoA hydratase-related protein [Bacillota bacterium]|nr:enoyl-CoA hydratase-related protein [Bacillota bacterium]